MVVSYKAEQFSLSFFSKRSAPRIKPDMTIIPIMTEENTDVGHGKVEQAAAVTVKETAAVAEDFSD